MAQKEYFFAKIGFDSVAGIFRSALPEGAGEVVRMLKSNIGLRTGARAETGLVGGARVDAGLVEGARVDAWLKEGARVDAGLLPMSVVACSGAVEKGR